MRGIRGEIIANLPGKATHFRPGQANVSACGIVNPTYAAWDARHADCRRCAKSVAYKKSMGIKTKEKANGQDNHR